MTKEMILVLAWAIIMVGDFIKQMEITFFALRKAGSQCMLFDFMFKEGCPQG
jgi:hypothetical protein